MCARADARAGRAGQGEAYRHKVGPIASARITHLRPKKDAVVDYTTSYDTFCRKQDIGDHTRRPQTAAPAEVPRAFGYGLGEERVSMFKRTFLPPQEVSASPSLPLPLLRSLLPPSLPLLSPLSLSLSHTHTHIHTHNLSFFPLSLFSLLPPSLSNTFSPTFRSLSSLFSLFSPLPHRPHPPSPPPHAPCPSALTAAAEGRWRGTRRRGW